MVDLESLPIVGKVFATGGVVLDVVLHSGQTIVHLVAALFEVLLGSPELAVAVLSLTHRLNGMFDVLPVTPMQLKMALAGALLVLLAKHLTEFASAVDKNA